MPTGYTAAIADGISFEKFVWRCARNMGALIMMRDEPYDAPVREFEPSDYNAKELAAARARLESLKGMTIEDAEVQADLSLSAALESSTSYSEGKTELEAKYWAMLSKVRQWEPPSEDHRGLRDFMISQIEDSIRYDCGDTFEPPKKLTGEEWLAQEIASAIRDIKYHSKANQEELDRTEARNRWVRQLRESVPPPVSDDAT